MKLPLVIEGPVTGKQFRQLVYRCFDVDPIVESHSELGEFLTIRDTTVESDRLSVWYALRGAIVRVQCEITFGVKTKRPIIELGATLQSQLNQLSGPQWTAVQEFTKYLVWLEGHLAHAASTQELVDHDGLQDNWLY